jgi:hypothetical protein
LQFFTPLGHRETLQIALTAAGERDLMRNVSAELARIGCEELLP